MKSQRAASLLRKHLLPEFPGFRVHRNLLYCIPVGDILRGCIMDSSAFSGSRFNVSAFVQPLYVPATHLNLTFGRRLVHDGGEWWDDSPGGTMASLVDAIRNQALPLINQVSSALAFVIAGRTLVTDPSNVHFLEAFSLSAFRAELLNEGFEAQNELLEQLERLDQSLEYVAAMKARATDVRDAATGGIEELQELLSGWARFTWEQLRIPSSE